MSSFVNNFRPENGDVAYGISTSRSIMLQQWEAHWKAIATDLNHRDAGNARHKLDAAILITCDHYNNHFELAEPESYAKSKILKDRLKKGKKGKYSQMVDDKMLGQDQKEQINAYADALGKSRFSPARVLKANDQKLGEEGADPGSWLGTHDLQNRKDQKKREQAARSVNVTQLAIRRACKFGIGLIAGDGPFSDAKVHFILDGLVMSEVVDNRANTSAWLLPGGETKEAINITISELRYVYRNWGKLLTKVNLYVNGVEVVAPWLSDWKNLKTCHPRRTVISANMADWLAYGNQRSQKYPNGLPQKTLI